jgi:cytochrome c-type biogenesis protein CcmH
MASFIVIAALMAAIAAAAVAWPLLRSRGSRPIGALAALVVVGAAAGLYPLWSNWDWNAPPEPDRAAVQAEAAQASPEVASMVAKLEGHLKNEPNDMKGWLLMGRSYLALQRLDDAVVAYDHAYRLGGGKDVEAALGFGEALSYRAGGDITPQAAKLFEEGVALAPENPKALLYGGFAAASRGDYPLARTRWLALKAQHPPTEVEKMLDDRIAELGAEAGAGPMTAAGGAPPAAPVAVDPKATATVNIRIAPELQGRLQGEPMLFVSAREPGVGGPPLAAKRLTAAAIGTQIQLSAADSMMPGRMIVAGQKVSITARISFSGQPLPTSGDLFGELSYDVGRDGARDLVIDKVTP